METQSPFPFVGDISQCDQEPIHIPGRIQPHGVLLVLHGPAFTILQVSRNCEEVLGLPAVALIGHPIANVLTAEDMKTLREVSSDLLERNPLYLFTLLFAGSPQRFDGILHRRDEVLVLELEPVQEEKGVILTARSKDIYRTIQVTFSRLQQSASLAVLVQQVVAQVRELTGFDRVMVYRFEPDGHGVVIAEAKREDMVSFMDLHYPASDIPVQARTLYVLNWLRIIPDRMYTPVPLVPPLNPLTQTTLDMSYMVLRSVSPLHLEYLGNMGVRASMSISIVKENQLWGLIACHHESPKYVSYEVRTACELVGRMMSLQVPLIEESERIAYLSRLKDVQEQLITSLSQHDVPLTVGLTRGQPNLLDIVAADGATVCIDGTCSSIGKTPSEREIEQLLDWLVLQPEEEVFETNSLPQRYPEAHAWKEVGSGLLALVLSKPLRQYLLWFRPEIAQTVQWAGEPIKLATPTEQGIRLSPRLSFESWKQEVAGTALPWQRGEKEAVVRLRATLIHVILRQAEVVALLNRELERSNIELDAFAYVASHDLKEPLRGIHNYAHFLLEDYADLLDEEGVSKLHTVVSLTQRMEDLMNSLLYYSRMGHIDLSLREIDMNVVVEHAREMLCWRIEESGAVILVPTPLPTVACDGIRITEVFTNLMSNAMKYTEKPPAQIEIGVLPLSSPSASPVFYVRDNGIGIAAEHYDAIFRIFKRLHTRDEFGGGTGAGLTIVKRIIERHGGAIWVESVEGEGSTFFWTLNVGEEGTLPV